MSGTYMQHEGTNRRDPICTTKLPTGRTLYATKSYQWLNPICNRRLPMVGTLYARGGYQYSEPYMQHEVTNGRDLICNMKLPIGKPNM